MGSINRVTILGALGNEPTLMQAKNGKLYTRVSVATHRRIPQPEGPARKDTQWHSVMIWGKNAETVSLHCQKGGPIYIEGHLTSYLRPLGEDGKSMKSLSIVADVIQLIPGSRAAMSFESEDHLLPSPPLEPPVDLSPDLSAATFEPGP